MEYSITYGRKVRTRAYEILEITFYMEFDEKTPIDEAFKEVKDRVDQWIEATQDKLIEKAVPRKGE